MTTTDTTVDHHDTDEHDHPTDGAYVKIALILGVLTAIEVATYFLEGGAVEISRDVLVPIILVIMVIKFAIVALYFMHLKFDDPLLSRVFLAGIVIALAVFIATLSTMQFWDNSGVPDDYPENLRLVNQDVAVALEE